MKKALILILTIFPLTLLAQELKCCESEKEVESYLSGNWKMKLSGFLKTNEAYLTRIGINNYQLRYEFNDGCGISQTFRIKENGTLEEIKESQHTIQILKTDKGFKIESNIGPNKAHQGIKYLDSTKLITIISNRIQREFYRLPK